MISRLFLWFIQLYWIVLRQIMQHPVCVGLCGDVMELLLHRVIKAT